MVRYVGLDVHASTCTFVVLGPSGRKLRSTVVETSGPALIQFLKEIPGECHLCFEEGVQSDWLFEILSPHATDVVVAGLGVRKALRHNANKSDALDAQRLAEALRVGSLEQKVFKETGAFGPLRELVRVHTKIVQDHVRLKNRVKTLYRARGLTLPRAHRIFALEDRETWIEALPRQVRIGASILFETHDALTHARRRAERALIEEAHKHPIIEKLRTCPGIGEIRAAQIAAIVVSPHRFRTKRQLWAYAGLAIITRSSADWTRGARGQWERSRRPMPRGLTRNFNRILKSVFKGAATTALGGGNEGPLVEHYSAMLEGGTKPNLAKLTIARQIAAIVLRLWKNEEAYDPSKIRKKQS